uniref:G-protein coupled receptors family 1 profile domain-containing protein n=1 Tax=Sparus aurata TaxID=8175 RepID=A0A671VBZ8_SPAAU
MENQTFSDDFILLEGLKVSSQSSLPAFVFLLLIYIFAVVSNISLVTLIFTTRRLHQPMYLLFCNMSINDIFGTSIITPHILRNIFIPPSERLIDYNSCVIQAFCVHLYAGAIILLGLTIRLSRCRRFIFNPFCDNATLFKLSCENVLINNIYGLSYTVVMLVSSTGSLTLTYLKIAGVCLRSKNKALNSKALQTCTTHLAVYIFLLVSCFAVIILHRFPHLSDHRKVMAVLIEVTLPALNAVIYGLQIKEIKQRIITLFNNSKVT